MKRFLFLLSALALLGAGCAFQSEQPQEFGARTQSHWTQNSSNELQLADAVMTTVVGTSDKAQDLGTATNRWDDIYSDSITASSATFSGSALSPLVIWDGSTANTTTIYGGESTSTFGGSISPDTNDGAAVGGIGNAFSDLRLASGGIIDWNSSDVTLTHSANRLQYGGGDFAVDDDFFNAIGSSIDAGWKWETADADAHFASFIVTGSNNVIFSADDNIDWGLTNSTDTHVCVQSADQTTTADRGCLFHDQTNFNLDVDGGDLILTIAGANLLPSADDVWAIGASGTGVSDIFFASTSVVDFSAGDVTITHTSNVLTFAGAASGYTFNNGLVTGSAGFFTNSASGARVGDSSYILFGDQVDAGLRYSSTFNSLNFGLANGDGNRALVISEYADIGTSWGLGNHTNPIVYIMSADAALATRYIGFYNDQTDANILFGAGALNFKATTSSANTMTLDTTPSLSLTGSASGYFNVVAGSANAGLQFRGRITSAVSQGSFSFLNDAFVSTDSFNASSNEQWMIATSGTIHQSGTAGFRGLVYGNLMTSSTGSGTVDLLRLDATSTRIFSISKEGLLTVNAASASGFDFNGSATTFSDSVGMVDIARSGNLTGVDTQTIIDLSIEPTFTLTEPGAGTAYYYGMSLDMSPVSVTAGAGTSQIAALRLIANGDADVGTNMALFVESGSFKLGDTGVVISDDSDGAITFLGAGTGSDENFIINLDDTANTIDLSSGTGVNNVRWDTGTGVGQLTLDGSTGGCIVLRDTDDAGWTEIDALDGVLTASIDADGLCD